MKEMTLQSESNIKDYSSKAIFNMSYMNLPNELARSEEISIIEYEYDLLQISIASYDVICRNFYI